MSRKFTWDAWDFDCDGSAYIIAKDECPNREDVPDFICREDGIHPECKPDMVVEEGWAKTMRASGWAAITSKSRRTRRATFTERSCGDGSPSGSSEKTSGTERRTP